MPASRVPSGRRTPSLEAPTSLVLALELVYDPGCPRADEARALLGRALLEARLPAVWTEWCTDDPVCPDRYRSYGSPTILVNGRDVAPGPHPWTRRRPGSGPRARRYEEGGQGTGRVPPLDTLRAAIEEAVGPDAG